VCFGRNQACATCKGTNTWNVYRCPDRILDPIAWEVCLYAAGEYSALPAAGGMLDQCSSFVQALRFAGSEKRAYSALAREEPNG